MNDGQSRKFFTRNFFPVPSLRHSYDGKLFSEILLTFLHTSVTCSYISSVGNISWFYHQYLDIFLSNFMKIFVFLQNI